VIVFIVSFAQIVQYVIVLEVFFSLDGRMRRRTYGLVWLGSHSIASLPILGLTGMMFGQIPRDAGLGNFLLITALVLQIFTAVVVFFAATKRLHDMDESGQMAFLMFAPVVGVMYGIWILLQPYSDLGGENKYGFNPRLPMPKTRD
jgi:uncharacterized membrane protein YhaH (DUF805 family)